MGAKKYALVKNHPQLLPKLYKYHLQYEACMKRMDAAAKTLHELREPRRLAWLEKQRKELEDQMKKQQLHQERLAEEKKWAQNYQDEMRFQKEHVEEAQLMLDKFLGNLRCLPQENPEVPPLPGYDSPVRENSESGDTIHLDLFLGDMDLE